MSKIVTAQEALKKLQDGNKRFVSHHDKRDLNVIYGNPADLANQQDPFAIILGCSDSRVTAEIIFDQGLGELFVIRVAGNIAASSQVGSIEFAAVRLKPRLVVVLGHSYCGAILTTLEALRDPAQKQSKNLLSIVDHVRPSIEKLLKTDIAKNEEALVRQAVRDNIQVSVDRLRNHSPILKDLINNEGLQIVGAEYSLETGKVEFLDKLRVQS